MSPYYFLDIIPLFQRCHFLTNSWYVLYCIDKSRAFLAIVIVMWPIKKTSSAFMAKHVSYLYEETNAHCPNTAVKLLVQEEY